MSDSIIIKQITLADVNALSVIALQAYCDHYLHLWHDGGEWYKQKSFSVEQLSGELKNTNAKFYLICINNDACGFLKLNIDVVLDSYEDINSLELERIYIAKFATGRGVGRYSMEFVLGLAKELDKKMIWLKVMDSSADAISFYKKQGFEICGTYHLDFEQMKEEFRGMYVMKRNIA